MASDIWLRTILIMRKETRCRHMGYSFRLTARVLLYAPSHRQDNTYHGLCYTSREALAGTRNSSMGRWHRSQRRQAHRRQLSYCPSIPPPPPPTHEKPWRIPLLPMLFTLWLWFQYVSRRKLTSLLGDGCWNGCMKWIFQINKINK